MIVRRTVLGWLAGIMSGFGVAHTSASPNAGFAGTKLDADPADRLKTFTKAFESLAQSVYYPIASTEAAYLPLTYEVGGDGMIFDHQYIRGAGATAIEAIDDWYIQMPKGSVKAVIWRVEPELDKWHDFCTDKTTYTVISRFAIVPLGVSL